MESLYNKNEDYCNLDASVLALMDSVPEEASLTQIHSRIAMIRLQQATILGHSKFAAKQLENAIEEGSKDRTAHSLLQEKLDELQDRISTTKRQETKQQTTVTSQLKSDQVEPTSDENKRNGNEEVSSEEVSSEKIQRLEKELKAEAARADSLEDWLYERLFNEILSIKEAKIANQSQETHIQSRTRDLEKAIHRLPKDDRSNKLRDKFGETLVANEYTQPKADCRCIVCHDRAVTLAVIPCGHLCLCDSCVKLVEAKSEVKKQCPVCRGPLLSTLKIYTTK